MLKWIGALWQRTILLCIVCLFMVVIPVLAREAPQPVVNWSADVFAINGGGGNRFLSYPGVREALCQAISDKLHVLQQAGKLPFQLQEVSTGYGIQYGQDAPIGLIPMVMLDTSFDTSYTLPNGSFYKSLVVSGLDLAFCSADEETHSWRILATIPLRSYDIIGQDIRNPLRQPASDEMKAAMYTRITVNMIQNHLDFTRQKDLLSDLETKTLLPETYQVTDVTVSSPRAQTLFKDRQEEIRDVIGGFFTSQYQQSKKRIIYPSMTAGAWKEDVNRNLYSLQMDSPSGAITVTMEKAKYPIQLDVMGIASGEIQTKDPSAVTYTMGYKAWLKKSPVEGKEQSPLTKVTMQQFLKRGRTQVDEKDIYMKLFIDLARDMAAQKV